jgi:lipopolysaccharide transport system ATP-binding protein
MENNKSLIYSARSISVCYKTRAGILKSADHWVLKELNLDIYKGESLAIVGRNGAGKSTLMKLIAGIISPDNGDSSLYSENATLLSLQAGFMPQISGRENIYLSGLLLGLTKAKIDLKLSDIISYADIGDFIDKPVGTYSSGMKARLGFAVALYSDPEMVLIDEVLGVGDSEFKEKSSAAIHEMVKSDHTVVFVSHNPEIVRELCDRAVWLENGKVVLDSTPDEVLNYYDKFNMICSILAKKHNWTESQVRYHENNKNPIEVIRKFEALKK